MSKSDARALPLFRLRSNFIQSHIYTYIDTLHINFNISTIPFRILLDFEQLRTYSSPNTRVAHAGFYTTPSLRIAHWPKSFFVNPSAFGRMSY